jgi:hypothetical protein
MHPFQRRYVLAVKLKREQGEKLTVFLELERVTAFSM